MNCMKCGRETTSEQVFCEECLLDMEKHPVKPGTVVVLPKRRDYTAVKKPPKKRTVPLEDQIRLLKKRIRILSFTLLLVLAGLIAMIYPTVQYLKEDHFKIGQNYNSVSSTTVPTEVLETIAE